MSQATYGDPRLPQRFWDKVFPTPETGCWLWAAGTIWNGYGQIYAEGGRKAPKICAHRWSYSALVEDIPDGLHIDHLCRVRSCVNPEHLRAVTPRENMFAPGSQALAALQVQRTRCPRRHPLVHPNLIACQARTGKRTCLACNRAGNRVRYFARRGAVLDLAAEADIQYARIVREEAA